MQLKNINIFKNIINIGIFIEKYQNCMRSYSKVLLVQNVFIPLLKIEKKLKS